MKVQCLCENKFEVTPITSVDLDADQNFVEKLTNGTFNRFKCPKCGTMVCPDVIIHLNWPSKRIKLSCVPEKKRYLCLAFCKDEKAASKSDEKKPFNAGETPVIGKWELLDRINCIKAGLDPVVLEALKFVVLDGAKEDKSKIEIALKTATDEKLEFFVEGVGKQIGIIGVPFSLYRQMEADYKKKKKSGIFQAVILGDYISAKNIFIES